MRSFWGLCYCAGAACSYVSRYALILGFMLLRRRAAPALLIQKPDFETIKCPSDVCTGKNEQNTQNMCAGQTHMLFAVFEQSIFKVPKKSAFAR